MKNKISKKTAMILSFAVGATMFATTAMADIATKSGYEQMKDSVKLTAERCSSELDSFTTDVLFVMKHNGNIVFSDNQVEKYDLKAKARESNHTMDKFGRNSTNYYYSDTKESISKHSGQDAYSVVENPQEYNSDNKMISNPFEEDIAADAEKILDAVVGNLKDYVAVTENPDGSKEFNGALSEIQIPALVNALASFQLKNEFRYTDANEKNQLPKLSQDIYVKGAKGKMVVDKNGLVQSVLGTGILVGKDKDENEHELSLEVLIKVTDVNSTVVIKPDLTGQKVNKSIKGHQNDITNPEKFIGNYKNNIVIEKDGKFVKIGERVIEITQYDGTNIVGKYSDVYKPGFEDYNEGKKEFTFTAKHENNDKYSARFHADSSEGDEISGYIYLQPNSKLIFSIIGDYYDYDYGMYDEAFNRVMD